MGFYFRFGGRKCNITELAFQWRCHLCLSAMAMQAAVPRPGSCPQTRWLQQCTLDQNEQKLNAAYQPHVTHETHTWPLGCLLM